MRILVLDNKREPRSWGSSNIVHWLVQVCPKGTEIIVNRPPDSDLPPLTQAWSAIVISGSGTSCLDESESWIPKYDQFVAEHLERKTPILGICYGHQTLARILARKHQQLVRLRKSPKPEFGWVEVQLDAASRLTQGLPPAFFTYESHFEEVYELPPGTQKIAHTDRCAIQGFEVNGHPAFGLQFHPEYLLEEAEMFIAEKLKSKTVPKDAIFNPGRGKKLYQEAVATTIFKNFVDLASAPNATRAHGK